MADGFLSSIGSLFSTAPGQAASAALQKAAKQGFSGQKKYLQGGEQQALGYQQQALPQWQQIFAQGQNLVPTAQGALGVGTPQQIAAAGQAFQQSIPGQEFQALLPDIYETSLRRGGVTGQTGQIPIDLTNRAMQALDQFYPGWQASLEKGYGLEGVGAQGQTGVYGTESNIATRTAENLANAVAQKYQTIGQAQAGAATLPYYTGQNALSALFGLGSLGVSAMTGGLGGFGLPSGGGGGLGGEALAGMGGGGPFMSNAGNVYYGG